jgi:hypothetical protein
MSDGMRLAPAFQYLADMMLRIACDKCGRSGSSKTWIKIKNLKADGSQGQASQCFELAS